MSSRRENHKAHSNSYVDLSTKAQRSIVSLLPMDDLRRNREALVETFAQFAVNTEAGQEWVSSRSTEEIRQTARRPAQIEFDPHPFISRISEMYRWLVSLIKNIGWFLILVGAAGSFGTLAAFGLQLQKVPGKPWNLVSPALLAAVFLLMHFYRADTFAHQLLKEEMEVIGGRLCTRDRQKLFGYMVWNRSLIGHQGLLLLLAVYVLDLVSNLPIVRRFVPNLRDRVLETIRRNAATLYDCDGVIDAIRTLWRERDHAQTN